MNALLFRTRAAVLWVAVAVAAAVSLVLILFVPGAVGELVAGEIEGETLTDAMGWMFMAIGAIPLVMVAVTLLVGDRANRIVNLVGGLAFGLFGVFAVVSHSVAGDFNGHVVMAGVAGILAFLIAGLSLVELRRPTMPMAVRESEPIRSRQEATV
jgi:tellurite resistance protein TehA-like permease